MGDADAGGAGDAESKRAAILSGLTRQSPSQLVCRTEGSLRGCSPNAVDPPEGPVQAGMERVGHVPWPWSRR